MRRFFSAVMIAALCTSCAARINGALGASGQAELYIRAVLEPRITALIRGLAAAGGAALDGPVLDGPAIAGSMSAAPGIASVSFRNTAPEAVEGPVKVSRIGDFLASGSGFITFEQGRAGGRCVITISLDTGPRILSGISPEVADYLSILMAPLATGEALGKEEYLALVRSVYGGGIAAEISASTIRASVEFPGPVKSVKGGTFSGRRAEFLIPLPDLLVLERPLSYEVEWHQGGAD